MSPRPPGEGQGEGLGAGPGICSAGRETRAVCFFRRAAAGARPAAGVPRAAAPWLLARPLHNGDFLFAQAVQVIDQPVNLGVRGRNLTLDNSLLCFRLRGGKLLVQR